MCTGTHMNQQQFIYASWRASTRKLYSASHTCYPTVPDLSKFNFRHREELHELLLVPSGVSIHETDHKEPDARNYKLQPYYLFC